MNIFVAFCFFPLLDGACNKNRRKRETKSQILHWTLRLEGAQLRKCVKQQNEDEKKNTMHVYCQTKR